MMMMMMMVAGVMVAAAGLMLVEMPTAHAQPRAAEVTLLEANSPLRIEFGAAGPFSRQYSLDVPADASRVVITTANARGDIDLFARFGSAMQSPRDAHAQSAGPTGDETILLARDTQPALRPGTWFILVVNHTRRPDAVTLNAQVTTATPRPSTVDGVTALRPGEPLEFEIGGSGDAAIQHFSIDVPAEAQALTVKLVGGRIDLDLFVQPNRRIADLGAAAYNSRGETGDEEVTVFRDRQRSVIPLTTGTWFIAVQNYDGIPTKGTVTATLDAEQPIPEGQFRTQPDVQLTPGTAHEFALPIQTRHHLVAAVTVPEGTKTVLFQLTSVGDADLDLFVRFGEAMRSGDDADWSSAGMTANETIFVGEGDVRPGTYFVVVHNYDLVPTTGQLLVTLDAPAAPESDDSWRTGADRELVVGETMTIEFPYANSHHFVATFTVPEGSSSVMVRLEGGAVDLDLFLRHNAPMRMTAEADYESTGDTATEVIFLAGDEAKPGPWFVVVNNYGRMPTQGTLRVELNVDPPLRGDVDAELRPGEPHSFTFPRSNNRDFYTFVFRVPEDARSVLLRTTDSTSDLDMYVKFGQPVTAWSSRACDYVADSGQNNEVLWWDRESRPALRTGIYYVDVRNYDRSPVNAKIIVRFNEDRPSDFRGSQSSPADVVALEAGSPRPTTLNRQVNKYTTFTIDVPVGAGRLHIAVYDSTADIDIYARHGQPVGEWSNESTWDHRAYSSRVNETLIISAESVPALRAGRYYIDVVCYPTDFDVTYTIVATIDSTPTLPPLALPPYRQAGSALHRAIDACVSVESESGTGSGTVVSPNGYVITNFHVIGSTTTGEHQTDDILISFTFNSRHAPRQTHVAKVIKADKDLDLALLKIYQTVRGDIVDDATANFTWLAIGNSEALDLGDALTCLGFPDIGGERARNSITLTRGVVSGFESRSGEPFWIKTDANISPGNSGGTTINARGELVGVPTMIINREGAIMGYVRPVSRIPDEWREIIRENTPRRR